MKISYLMDTKKLLNDKFKKKGINNMGGRQDSDSDEDELEVDSQAFNIDSAILSKNVDSSER